MSSSQSQNQKSSGHETTKELAVKRDMWAVWKKKFEDIPSESEDDHDHDDGVGACAAEDTNMGKGPELTRVLFDKPVDLKLTPNGPVVTRVYNDLEEGNGAADDNQRSS